MARQSRPKLFDETKDLISRCSHFSAHQLGHANYDAIDLPFLNKLGDPADRILSERNRCQRVSEQSQLVGNGQTDAGAAEIDSQNRIHARDQGYCNSGGSLLIRFLIFSA